MQYYEFSSCIAPITVYWCPDVFSIRVAYSCPKLTKPEIVILSVRVMIIVQTPPGKHETVSDDGVLLRGTEPFYLYLLDGNKSADPCVQVRNYTWNGLGMLHIILCKILNMNIYLSC